MTGFNHGMTGAVIAVALKTPWIAVPASLASHYLADMVPHFGFKRNQVFSKKFNLFHESDFVFGLVLMLVMALLFPSQKFLIWSCMIIAALPDLVWWFYRKSLKDWPKGFDRFTMLHWRINARSHVENLYFDIGWFTLMWGIILIIKL